MKWRQLSLFNDKQVERNPLTRCYFNPQKELINRFRLEVFYKVDNPQNRWLVDSLSLWNIRRHINGMNPVKIGRRYFYDNNAN